MVHNTTIHDRPAGYKQICVFTVWNNIIQNMVLEMIIVLYDYINKAGKLQTDVVLNSKHSRTQGPIDWWDSEDYKS